MASIRDQKLLVTPSALRESTLMLLDRYQAGDSKEKVYLRKIKSFVEQNLNCFDPNNSHGHITNSALVMDPKGTHVLLTHHRKLGKWLQLGGHVRGDEDLLQAALREVREESGIFAVHPLCYEIFDVDVHSIPERDGFPAHYHYDIRFLFQAEETGYLISEESFALSWVPLESVKEGAFEESLCRLAMKARLFLADRVEEILR